MSKSIHIKSLRSTLRENSAKTKKYTKEFVYWVFVFALALLCITFLYLQHTWLYYLTNASLLTTVLYYFIVINRCWKTNEKIKQKIRQLNKESSL